MILSPLPSEPRNSLFACVACQLRGGFDFESLALLMPASALGSAVWFGAHNKAKDDALALCINV